jgi:hypothetical protein
MAVSFESCFYSFSFPFVIKEHRPERQWRGNNGKNANKERYGDSNRRGDLYVAHSEPFQTRLILG